MPAFQVVYEHLLNSVNMCRNQSSRATLSVYAHVVPMSTVRIRKDLKAKWQAVA